MAYPFNLKLRAGSYVSFRALVNDTNDNILNPLPAIGDCYVIELAGGIDAKGTEVKANDIVVYDSLNWLVLPEEDAATLR